VRPRLVLASASPARLRVLRSAGFDPEVVVCGVDEDLDDGLAVASVVAVLAERKALAVAAHCAEALVIGCDSLLDVGGRALGKPAAPADAVALWAWLRGREGTLRTGHCVVDTRSGATAQGMCSTVVRFGTPTDAEIDAYVATGEPLTVAGGFTLEGFGAPFVDGIDGDAGNVLGLSLPTLRSLLAELGVAITDLWSGAPRA